MNYREAQLIQGGMDSLRSGLLQGAMLKQQRDAQRKAEEEARLNREERNAERASNAEYRKSQLDREMLRDADNAEYRKQNITALDAYHKGMLTKADNANQILQSKAQKEADAMALKAETDGANQLSKELERIDKNTEMDPEAKHRAYWALYSQTKNQTNKILQGIWKRTGLAPYGQMDSEGIPFEEMPNPFRERPAAPVKPQVTGNVRPADINAMERTLSGYMSQRGKIKPMYPGQPLSTEQQKLSSDLDSRISSLQNQIETAKRTGALVEQGGAPVDTEKAAAAERVRRFTGGAADPQAPSAEDPTAAIEEQLTSEAPADPMAKARAEALQAIKQGAPQKAVRERFFKTYGKPL